MHIWSNQTHHVGNQTHHVSKQTHHVTSPLCRSLQITSAQNYLVSFGKHGSLLLDPIGSQYIRAISVSLYI